MLSDDSQRFPRRWNEPSHARESVAILIHGTFASAKESHGNKWWQLGSPFSEKLRRHLPRGVRLYSEDEAFHWSGENSERARSKAAIRLLAHLRRQEQEGKDYHLVGHSHGGSVIWHALKLASLKKQKLNGLRSWTTVGTPFLQHRGRSIWNPANCLCIMLAIMLLFPFMRSVKTVAETIHHAFVGSDEAVIAKTDQQVGYGAILRYPLLAAAESLGISVRRMDDGIHLGSYEPGGRQSFGSYMCTTREGILLIALALTHVFIGLQMILWSIAPALESRRIRAEKKLEELAYQQFGSRWLGLWSRDDEAINGLRATLKLSVQFVRKMVPHDRVFVSDKTSIMSRPIFWATSPVFNSIIQPLLDRYVRKLVVRSAQGNDRPTATLVGVTATPLQVVSGQFTALPDELSERLLQLADNHASQLAPKIRRWLGSPTFQSGIESLARDISGMEMIHTSYFLHDEIAGLICCNVALGTPHLNTPRGDMHLSTDLLDWFEKTKRILSRNCDPDPLRTEVVREAFLRRAA